MPKIKGKEYLKQIVTCKGVPIRLSADFSKETLQSRSDRQEIFKVMKSRNLQSRKLYTAKLSFRIEGQINSFPDLCVYSLNQIREVFFHYFFK